MEAQQLDQEYLPPRKSRRHNPRKNWVRISFVTLGLTIGLFFLSFMELTNHSSSSSQNSVPVHQNIVKISSTPVAKAADVEPPSLPDGLTFGKMVWSIPQSQPTVYLTFDDGPSAYLKEIVNILDENHIKGSFFWIGDNVKKDNYADFGKEMIQEGHVIGNHTMHHETMKSKTLDQQIEMIEENGKLISDKIGHPVLYFRPPYGAVDQNTIEASMKTGEILAYWQVDSEDWKYPHDPKKVYSNIEKEVKPGSIILMHEKQTTAQMLPEIIKILKAKGYQFAPLPTPEENKA